MPQDQDPPRTVSFPPAPPDDGGGGRPIVAIFGLAPQVSTEGPHARAVTARAIDRARATGDPVEIDLDDLEAAAVADAALPRVPVIVGTVWIEDGSTRPALGDIIDQTLRFVEINDPADDLARDWDVTVEPIDPTTARSGPALVHGPGWTAVWGEPGATSGATRVRGVLSISFDGSVGGFPTLGRVTGLWVITQTIDQTDGNHNDLSRTVPGSLQLDPVEISPRWFDHGHGRPDGRPPPAPPRPDERLLVFTDSPPPPDPWVCEIGVLLELDLVPDRTA